MAAALFPKANANGLVLLGSTPSETFHLYSELRSIFFSPKSKSASNKTQKSTSNEKSKGGFFASFSKRKVPPVPIKIIPTCDSDSDNDGDDSASVEPSSPPPPYSALPEFGMILPARPTPVITSFQGRIPEERRLRKSRSHYF